MDLVNRYLQTLSSDQTTRAYRYDLRQFFGDDPVDVWSVGALDKELVQRFMDKMIQNGLSTATRRRRLSALRQFCNWLVDRGTIDHNPTQGLRIKNHDSTSSKKDGRALTREEVTDLIDIAGAKDSTGPRDRALLLTIIYGALRRSEVASLDVADVRPLGRHWIIDLDTSGTYVKVPHLVVEAIEVMKDANNVTSGPLWRSLSNRNYGQRMSPDAIYKVVRRVSLQAGLDPVDIDTLRRTGLHLAQQGGARLPHIRAHSRVKHSASAATYFESRERRGTLQESAVDFIDLDIRIAPSDGS